MILVNPVIEPNTAIDFYAGNDRSFRNLLPLWNAMNERRGTFFASHFVKDNTDVNINKSGINIDNEYPIVVSSYKDLNDIFVSCNDRPFIMYEPEHNTETRGLLNIVSLFLCNQKKTVDFRKGYSQNAYLINDIDHAAKVIFDYCKGKEVKHITEANGKSVGIVYMAWGDKAMKAIKKSLASLRFIGYSYPVAIIGDFKQDENWTNGDGCNIVCNTNPFDTSKERNFQFRAGRVKPQVCNLSPFDYTLYIDADTKFIQPIQAGFEMLSNYDLIVTEEKLTLYDLYNKKLAGWELNLLERDETIKELGDGNQKFINSGVMFFKRNKKTLKLFADWYRQWMRYQEWDEQLALMRAINENKSVKINRLGVEWNSPHVTDQSIIFHNYGRGEVRINV